MGKGSKKTRPSQFSMDEECGGIDSTAWMTGPLVDGCDDMDTREAGIGNARETSIKGESGGKEKHGKRGSRSRNQKKRKAVKMEKAVAIASRQETKVTKRSTAASSKKSLKSLWVAGKVKR